MDISQEILSQITIFNKYAKYIPELARRETWTELVDRNMDMHIRKFPALEGEIRDAYRYVYEKKVLPSMRSMQFAGKSIEINPARIYNCCFLPIDDYRAFGEVMFLLLGGTGVGYSVQRHHVDLLPEIRKSSKQRRFLIGDSIEGWADAVKALMKAYFGKGTRPVFDFSDIRPKGARLVTAGGKAPGPEPLKACLYNIESVLKTKEDGEKLTTIEAHDIVCYIADAVLAGGIRRAALISLFSLKDEKMLTSKSPFKAQLVNYNQYIGGTWPTHEINVNFEDTVSYTNKNQTIYVSEKDYSTFLETGTLPFYYFHPQRARANNSATILRHKIRESEFMDLWDTIHASRTGEPGIYFTNDRDWGTNPCCEIALRSFQFCNLCEVNVSDVHTQEELNARVAAAAFIGTLQASYTNFHYLRDIWKRTTEKDALIGVGMTGIGSGAVLNLDMKQAARVVKETNAMLAPRIGINVAARTTCVKPSGTTSCVMGTSSGIHAWHAEYYIRRMQMKKNEPLYLHLMINHPELVKDYIAIPDSAVVEIPQKAPAGSIIRTESAISLLERVKRVSTDWVLEGHRSGENTHNVSATVSIKEGEWKEVGRWMWDNRQSYNGLSVLPFDLGSYSQAPFEDISEESFVDMFGHLTGVDLSKVIEIDDTTNLAGEVACGAGGCELK